MGAAVTDEQPSAVEPVPRWRTIAEASADSGIPEGTLRRWINERRLPAERVGPRRLRVDLNELDKMRTPAVEPDDETTRE